MHSPNVKVLDFPADPDPDLNLEQAIQDASAVVASENKLAKTQVATSKMLMREAETTV